MRIVFFLSHLGTRRRTNGTTKAHSSTSCGRSQQPTDTWRQDVSLYMTPESPTALAGVGQHFVCAFS